MKRTITKIRTKKNQVVPKKKKEQIVRKKIKHRKIVSKPKKKIQETQEIKEPLIVPKKKKERLTVKKIKEKQVEVIQENKKEISGKEHKVGDLKIEERTLEDLYNEGLLKHKPETIKEKEARLSRGGRDKYDNSCFKVFYFKRLSKDLIVNQETQLGTLVWRAKDFGDGVRRHPYVIVCHYPPNEFNLIGSAGVKEDVEGASFGVQLYDGLCLIPSKQHKKHIKKQEIIETHIEGKKESVTNTNVSDVLSKIKPKVTKLNSKVKRKANTNSSNKKKKK